jgi:HAE1 family hydrophobic/amphiphilic exporter-1
VDVATQDVRDRVARARPRLPNDLEPPVVDRIGMGDLAILWIPFRSDRSAVETSEYLRRNIKPLMETIPGVASVQLFGRRDRNIRIWLDGDSLRARGLSAGDVLSALRREHVEVPGGRVESRRVEYTVKTAAEFESIKELKQLIVASTNGAVVRLSDVARVEDGSADRRRISRYDGKTGAVLGILKQSGGNTVAIVNEVRRRLAQVASILPVGISIDEGDALIDFSLSIRESVRETQFALIFGALLAILTVFVFLRRTRPTLIVAAAIPLSLITTFGLVWLFGYTLNTMTLLGMTLAIGVVIDDAIIVLENIERQREMGKPAYEAASVGTRQITFAATAATLSVTAVFLPVVFVEGIVGNFLGEFGLTVAGSVLISLFIALTLTPMLAARMPPPQEREHGSIYHRLEQGFAALEQGYREALAWSFEHRALTLVIAGLSLLVALLFGRGLGREFFPPADQSLFFARIEAPPGTTIDATLEYLERDEAWLLKQPEVAGLFAAVGVAGPHRPGRPNEGMLFATLKSRDKRERSVQDLIREAREVLGKVPGRKVTVFDYSQMVGGGGDGGQFEVELRGDLALADLDRLSSQFMTALEQRGGFVELDKSLKLGLPELRVIPDRDKAAALGVDARTLATAVQVMIGGMDVGMFKEGGHRYEIRARLEKEHRTDPSSIENLYVRATNGEVVELRNLVRIEAGAGPSEITRSNRQRSVTVSANLEGKTMGAAVRDAFEVADEVLPEGVTLSLAGQAEAMAEGGEQLVFAMLLAALAIYMVLAAQFESFIHPFTVMLALPLAMVGALGALYLSGMTLNLFSLIGIILLFGLVTKNSPIRMRPVLMTALSMIFGALPAALGVGPGSENRAPMAVATVAGMVSSTGLTLLVVPVFYLVLDDFAELVKRGARRLLQRPGPSAPLRPRL